MRRSPSLTRFIFVLLLIEFLDELTGGVREAAWPLIRADLDLNYTQIGLLLSLPGLLGNLIEPVLGILADAGKRRILILAGGCLFVLSSMMAAASTGFLPLLIAYIVFYPASGAFVNLSQTILMDLEPGRHEQNMSRWTFSGSVGIVCGPLLLSAAAFFGLGWRIPLWAVALLAVLGLAVFWRTFSHHPDQVAAGQSPPGFWQGVRNAGRALKRLEVLRWLVLLQFAELMMGVLIGFLALYLVDVTGLSPAQAGFAVAIWTGVGLIGDLLLIPLLERVPGVVYLRASAAVVLALFPAFLLAGDLPQKLSLLGLLGFFNAGWYAILKGQLYTAMPGQSGTAMSVHALAGLVHHLIPLGIGLVAQQVGLGNAMWLLILGPAALLVGLPIRSAPWQSSEKRL